MYVLPVFVYTDSELAKQLLNYRYDTLDDARDRAKVLGHMKGALYPWRTINGKEASTYFPLGTAQYHINADIAYAFKLYLDITGDDQYLIDRAAEVLVETARVWADVGCFAECKDNKYCICSVTGPDEYNAIVDNNFYTNLMARENIRSAMWALDRMKSLDEDAYNKLVEKLELEDEELEYWERIINNMYFPFDEKLQIYPQDDGFMMRKPWDESKIPEEKRHLLYENYHPLFVYRQKMSKQADAILGMLLHSNFFTEEELKLIGDMAIRYDTYVIMDEVYEHIVYAPHKHVYMSTLPGMWERTVSCSSLSKTYSITGWRLGYAIAPQHLMDRIKQFHDFNTVGAPSVLMEAAIAGLEMPDSYYEEFGAHYAHMKALFTKGLDDIGIQYTDPQGAYFVLANIGQYLKPGQTDVEFCEEMARKVGVACVPGTSFFNENVNDIIRVHFAKKDDTLMEALNRLADIKTKMA